MSQPTLIRLGAIAAIFAGILRGVGSFIPTTAPDTALQSLYFVTDIFIIFGVITLYSIKPDETGIAGLLGFVIAMIGVLIIRSSRAIAGMNLYPAGALIFSLGLNVLGITAWRAKILSGWIIACWVLSVALGFVVYFLPALSFLFVVAGVLFAVGFIGAGIQLWTLTNNKIFKE